MEGMHRELQCPGGNRRVSSGLVRQHAVHQVLGTATSSVLRHAGLTQGMRVADIGCGVGLVTLDLARAVGESGLVVGIDTDEGHLDHGRDLVARSAVRNVWFDNGSAIDTGLPRSSFELVFCRGALGRVDRPDDAVAELVSLLAPGGTLVCEELEEAPEGPVMLPGGRVLCGGGAPWASGSSVVSSGVGGWLPGEMRARGLLRIGVSFSRPISELQSATIAGGILPSGLALWQVWGRRPAESAASR